MKPATVNCPTCQKPVLWSAESEFRPFCSERCKLIDLGEWADERRVIPTDAEYDDSTATDLDRD
jgi:endogenous inhibitor of DNA gyrase (YacG/DUF329 family)